MNDHKPAALRRPLTRLLRLLRASTALVPPTRLLAAMWERNPQ